MLLQRTLATSLVIFSALATTIWAQSLVETSLTFLQRHGVPCAVVVKVDSTHSSDQVATCEDGSQWLLFWLENEVAFVQPGSQEPFMRRRAINFSSADCYGPHQTCEAP
jgi:hypothetical protein